MKISIFKVLLFCLLVVMPIGATAQWGTNFPVQVVIAPEHTDWNYKLGEEVEFTISVFEFGNLLKGAKIEYQIMPEKMDPVISESMTLEKGTIKVKGGSMKAPGFLRCKVTTVVDGTSYSNLATAGFEVENIKPTTTMPKDFDTFWKSAKEDAKKIPMNPEWKHLPELSDKEVDIYQIKLDNYRPNSKLYGVLSIPKKTGKYPAILKVPGAGVWPHFGAQDVHAKRGVITFEIRIHGVPIISEEETLYSDLYNGALWEYWNYNLDNKDYYYYKRVYLGCVRSVDFIHTLDAFDGENIAVYAGSQGGALSIVTPALNNRIDYLVAYYPALSDLTGYLKGRAGGWPHLFDKTNGVLNNSPARIETSKYYDVVNFASKLEVPGYYGWGYNDEVCPPTSMFAAYNIIAAPKKLDIMPDQGHFGYSQQTQRADTWLFQKLIPNAE